MSATSSSLTPAAAVLAAKIARRHYLEGASKSDIADELGLSRFKVARLLERARATGLVRIELHYQGEIDLNLSVALADHLGLDRTLVVTTPEESPEALRGHLGRVAAGLLTETCREDETLGLAWSRTAMAMRSALTALPRCAVVQLSGALSRPDVHESSIELVRDVARIGKGEAFCFYAPMIVAEAGTARSLREQTEVARAAERFGNLTKAVVTIGAWAPGDSTVADAVGSEEYERDRRAGVRAEICGIELDGGGRPVHTALSERIIGIGADELRATPEIIAIAYGTRKTEAVRAAVRGGFATTLITHTSLAETLLDRP